MEYINRPLASFAGSETIGRPLSFLTLPLLLFVRVAHRILEVA